MNDSGGNSGSKNGNRNVDCTLETLEGNGDCLGNWRRGHSCHILAKNLSMSFGPSFDHVLRLCV